MPGCYAVATRWRNHYISRLQLGKLALTPTLLDHPHHHHSWCYLLFQQKGFACLVTQQPLRLVLCFEF
ncbi:Eef1A Lysine Methyltransferase 2 [Manis pentadactyla]|nr:Eef1A Lysine Methyltransferase 2 [Manis pentadactyla]